MGREKEDRPIQLWDIQLQQGAFQLQQKGFQLFTMELSLIGQLETENRW